MKAQKNQWRYQGVMKSCQMTDAILVSDPAHYLLSVSVPLNYETFTKKDFFFPLSESPALPMYLLRLIHNDILHYTIKSELSDPGLYSLGFFLAADFRYHSSLSSR